MGKKIDDTVCHCLKMRRSAENVINYYDSMLAPSGVTVRQYSLLRAVMKNKGCSVRVLSEATLLERSTLARSLKPLINSGYIEDKKSIGARDSVLCITESGEEVCRKASKLWEKAQSGYESKLGKERVSALENTLMLIQEL